METWGKYGSNLGAHSIAKILVLSSLRTGRNRRCVVIGETVGAFSTFFLEQNVVHTISLCRWELWNYCVQQNSSRLPTTDSVESTSYHATSHECCHTAGKKWISLLIEWAIYFLVFFDRWESRFFHSAPNACIQWFLWCRELNLSVSMNTNWMNCIWSARDNVLTAQASITFTIVINFPEENIMTFAWHEVFLLLLWLLIKEQLRVSLKWQSAWKIYDLPYRIQQINCD